MNTLNWKIYLSNYIDLINHGLKTEEHANIHYKRFGKKEGRTDIQILSPLKIIDLSFEFDSSGYHHFYSSTPCIIKNDIGYLVNIRCVNYSIKKKIIFKENKTINICIQLDNNFIEIKSSDKSSDKSSIEDIKLFNFENILYYIGTAFDGDRYNITTNVYPENKLNFIDTDFGDNKCIEKNWCYFNYHNELCLIYQWYPIKICKIKENKLTCICIKETKSIFTKIRGSTNGYNYGNEIWFLTHYQQVINKLIGYCHLFVIFDLNMNILRYSDPFKFEGERIEYALGLIVEKNNIIISYSIFDCKSKIGIYNTDNFIFNLY